MVRSLFRRRLKGCAIVLFALACFSLGRWFDTPGMDSFADETTDGPRTYYYPGTEQLAADEMRVIALGSGLPNINKAQAATSFLVELGNGDKFIFDIGTSAIGNLAMLEYNWDELDKVFLGHLHFDHIGDLGALFIGGVSAGRNVPLRVWGPSGPQPKYGTRYMVEKLVESLEWELASKRGRTPGKGYEAVVTEFDYTKTHTVFAQDGVTIRAWPAIHAIDGPVSYSLEWAGLKLVFSSDTAPNKWMLSEGTDADLFIHEAFPTTAQLMDKYRLAPGPAWMVGTRVHTNPAAAGRIFSETSPRMAVAFHFVSNSQTVPEIWQEIRSTYDGPLSLAQDMSVWNVTKDVIEVRHVQGAENVWPPDSSRSAERPDTSLRMSVSQWLDDGRVEFPRVMAGVWQRLSPEHRARIRAEVSAEVLPEGAGEHE